MAKRLALAPRLPPPAGTLPSWPNEEVLRVVSRSLEGKVARRDVRLVLHALYAAQSPKDARAADDALPVGFAAWPPMARAIWSELATSVTWRADGWTHALMRPLAATVAERLGRRTCGVVTLRRWFAWLTANGVLERRLIARGGRLPDGRVAWCAHWIVYRAPAAEPARRRGSGRGRGQRTASSGDPA